ncbi:MAG: PHP-associated domain-containing protein [Thermoflexaceae bacterium]|nr:PHP-associated domain-containing protein [Thermoflexaceae bacterium]
MESGLKAEKMWRYDLHVHTSEVSPCGQMNVHEVVDAYLEKKYDGIWIANHFHKEFLERTLEMEWKEKIDFYLQPVREARKYAVNGFFTGLGMELRFLSDPNDYLIFGLTEELLYREAKEWLYMDLESFYKRYKDELIIIQAHPNREDSSYPADINYLHGMEAINTSPRHDSGNEKTQKILILNPWMIPTAGSDSHRPEDVGRSGILTLEEIKEETQLIQVFKKRAYRLIPN